MIFPHIHSGASFAGLKIGLLGGSFNPAHDGHLAMSLFALKRLGLDQVWWVVTPQNPLKTSKGMAPFAERLQKGRALACHPKILVTDIEAQLGTCYTVNTLAALKRRFPGTKFVWLMGEDNLSQIPRWRQWRKIFSSVPVAVFRRVVGDIHNHKAAQCFSAVRFQPSMGRKLALMQPPAWLVLDNRLNFLSGTTIRRGRTV